MRTSGAPGGVLVLGGTGGVGAGIVEALLAGGDTTRVLVASRDPGRLTALRERHAGDARLATIEGSLADDRTAAALLDATRPYGALRAVVASLGGWWEGPPLRELATGRWRAAFEELLMPHVVAARTFVPALEHDPHARYLLVGGGAATTPVPGSALVSIAGAAQLMLVRALVAERGAHAGPIVEELVIDGPVKTAARHHGPVRAGEVTAREAGDVVAAILRDGTTGAWPHVRRDGPVVTMYARPSPLEAS